MPTDSSETNSGSRSARRALEGRVVLVTRARHQAARLGEQLSVEGAQVVFHSAIRIAPPADFRPLAAAAQQIAGAPERPPYDWIVFTSQNAVPFFREALDAAGAGASEAGLLPPGVRIAAVGPATAEALEDAGLAADLIAETYVGEGLLEALVAAAGGDLTGTDILIPRAAEARDVLHEGLRAAGARVEVVEAYRTLPESEGGADLRRLLAEGVDIVTFTSPSTLRSVHALAADELLKSGAAIAVIGPVTAAAAEALRLPVEIVAERSTTEGLVQACVEWAGRAGAGAGESG